MAVITSTRLEAALQIDGRRAVWERHVADGGETEDRRYLADAGTDLDALLAANGLAFLEELANRQPPPPPPVPTALVGSGVPDSAMDVEVGGFYLDQAAGNLYQRTA